MLLITILGLVVIAVLGLVVLLVFRRERRDLWKRRKKRH